jgi:two-component system phosphate regulon response regulator PhoB
LISSTILIVEDDPDIREIMEYNLSREGLRVTCAGEGKEGLRMALEESPDLLLLDRMLPGMAGEEICRHLRAHPATKNLPIIMITAKGEESDIVDGLNGGADDYITKPFRPAELVARTHALLRRSRRDSSPSLEAGPVRVDPTRHTARLHDRELSLTATEFAILRQFVSRPGRVFSRDQLLAASRGENVDIYARTIDVHIASLRKKLGPDGRWIETVRGVGYRFREKE